MSKNNLVKQLSYEYGKDYDKIKNLSVSELTDLLEEEKKNQLIDFLVNAYHEDEETLKEMSVDELETLIDEIEDTSAMHPNESYDEFMEHEDY